MSHTSKPSEDRGKDSTSSFNEGADKNGSNNTKRKSKSLRPDSATSSHTHQSLSGRRNCFNTIFKQIFTIFRKKSPGYQGPLERNRQNRELSSTGRTSRNDGINSPIVFDRNDPVALSSILNNNRKRDGDDCNTDTGDDGEYIIYIPRVSRSKLQRKYLDPLKRANYDPIVIKPRSRRNNYGRQYLETGQNNSASSFHRGLRGTPLETLLEYATNANSPRDPNNNFDHFAYGDISPSGGSKTVLFYIPSKSEQPLDWHHKHSFRLHEKHICWHAIEKRHANAARNKQRILQELTERLQTYFEIWMRRKQVGDMKKKLAKDHQSVVCSPPNMLESRFHHIHWLGRGSNQNNSVGRYFDKEENTVVALKIFSDKPFETVLENLDNKLMAIQEIHSLNHMNHKNIVRLLGYFELNDKYHLILESCDHCLRQEIEEAPSGLGTSVSKKIIKYILHGLNFCHQAKCLHRDLSPENILVCRNGLVKVADFDRSAFITEGAVGSTSPTPGNYVYNSPEILAGDKEYGLPSDVWSLGIIFCELLTGKPPWNGKSAQSQLREIHNCVGPLLPRHASVAKLQVDEKSFTGVHNHAQLQQMFTTISAPCCSFIMKCLDVNPVCRFTCGELLHHQFMKGSSSSNYK